MADEQNVVGNTFRSASYNVILQVSFRILTFIMNGVLLRYTTRDMLGVVNVRLMLLQQTITFVSREAFRKACLSKSTEKRWPQVINLLWCVFPIGVALSSILGYIWIYYLERPDPALVSNYNLGVLVFASTGAVELLCEQLWVISQVFHFLRLKVVIEGIANFSRCFLTLFLVITFPNLGIICFCLAQVSFSLLIVILYYMYFIHQMGKIQTELPEEFPLKSIRDFFPSIVAKKPLISLEMANLTWSFFKQSFLKIFLTEGERFIMTIFKVLTFAEQGVYDVVNNLGSLVARCVFMPIEESYYTFFANILARDKKAKEQSPEAAKMAAQVLEVMLKFMVLIGLTIVVFGYAYSFLLLDIYGGTTLSGGEGPSLLRWYCLYVLIIAINGITECFMFAAMNKDEVDSYNYKMMMFSCFFLLASWYLTVFGSSGFIIANCLNMILRIFHSLSFILKYFKSTPDLQPLRGIFPSYLVLLTYALSGIITALSERVLCCNHGWFYRILHIGIGAVCLLLVAVAVLIKEKSLLEFAYEQFIGAKKKKKD
ncbi:protein RFT1 homolog [Actinia tenebrosa]|uniref:Protein RFT1 homolog n=1 Tax=Actinia tenebrosa TaxID=6105 RepID=A0A6P8IUK7_ACTTE|nr:protein RFT1 homolog [Actinia tenebrosa]